MRLLTPPACDRLDAAFGAYLATLPAAVCAAAPPVLRAFSPDQERDDRGRFGSGGGGGGAAKEPAGKGRVAKEPAGKTPKAAPKTPKADIVKKAQDKVARAKAAVAKAKDGLIKAQKELKELKAKAKAESPRAKAAAAKAKDAKPVDVTPHVQATKDLQAKLIAGKAGTEKRAYGNVPSYKFDVPHSEYRKLIDDHVAGLGKALNKEQVLAVAKGFGLTGERTKVAALKAIAYRLDQVRGSRARAYT